MARYFTKKITIEELADTLWHQRKSRDYKNMTPRVSKDLAKVEFDTENIADTSIEAYGVEKDPWYSLKNYVGFHTLSNGLSYLGITAGGDWEYPIFFMIYYDGKELRGYIPKEGNTWNYINNSAFGNDEEADEKGLNQRGISSMDELKFDLKSIENDITARILYKPIGESQ